MWESLSYVLPIRCAPGHRHEADLASYLGWVADRAELLLIDGSAPREFEDHRNLLPRDARHLPPAPELSFRNGKVNGVTTGVREASFETIVLADDDVRYDEGSLAAVSGLLEAGDLVVPQNVFTDRPWHARWDEARSLINRAIGTDYPGTFGLRRSRFIEMGGYDGDVLFENLEMMRTVEASGGKLVLAPGVFVPREPPEARTFLEQRQRQAYDDLAQPARLAAFLSIAPLVGVAIARRRIGIPVALIAAGILVAEVGRRKADGARVYPRWAALAAPLWVLERSVFSWVALLSRARGGARYRDSRLARAATPARALRRRFAQEGRSRLISGRRVGPEWLPSQSGFIRERPQRQRATMSRRTTISRPDSSISRMGPRTR